MSQYVSEFTATFQLQDPVFIAKTQAHTRWRLNKYQKRHLQNLAVYGVGLTLKRKQIKGEFTRLAVQINQKLFMKESERWCLISALLENDLLESLAEQHHPIEVLLHQPEIMRNLQNSMGQLKLLDRINQHITKARAYVNDLRTEDRYIEQSEEALSTSLSEWMRKECISHVASFDDPDRRAPDFRKRNAQQLYVCFQSLRNEYEEAYDKAYLDQLMSWSMKYQLELVSSYENIKGVVRKAENILSTESSNSECQI